MTDRPKEYGYYSGNIVEIAGEYDDDHLWIRHDAGPKMLSLVLTRQVERLQGEYRAIILRLLHPPIHESDPED